MCLYMYSALVQFYHFRRCELFLKNKTFVPEMINVGEFWGFHFSLNIALSLSYIIVKWDEDILHCKS